MAPPTFWSKILNHWVSFPSCLITQASMYFPKSGCFQFTICMCAFCLKCFFSSSRELLLFLENSIQRLSPLRSLSQSSWSEKWALALALCSVLYFTGCIKMTALSASPGGCKLSGHRDYSLFRSVFLMPDTSVSNKVLERWAEQLEKACHCITLMDKIHPDLQWPRPATAWSRA